MTASSATRASVRNTSLNSARPVISRSGRMSMPGWYHGAGEVGDALVLGHLGIGAGQQHAQVGLLAVGGPDLLAVDDPLVAVAHRPGLEPGQVRSGRRFREQLAPRLPSGDDGPDVAVDLLLGPVGGDGRGRQQQAETVRCPEGAELRDGLGDPHPVVAVEAPAVGVGGQGGGRPPGQTQALPPRPDGQLRIPLRRQPVVQLLAAPGRSMAWLRCRSWSPPGRRRSVTCPGTTVVGRAPIVPCPVVRRRGARRTPGHRSRPGRGGGLGHLIECPM